MTRPVDQEPETELLKFSYADFKCCACKRQISISLEESFLLANDNFIKCPLCQVSVKAGAYDQADLRNVHKSLSGSGGFIIPFATVWFSVSLMVALFVNTQVSVLMTSVGLLFSYALNNSKPVTIDVAIQLDPVIVSGDSSSDSNHS